MLTTNNTQQLTRKKVMAKKPMSKMAPKFTPCKECPNPAKCKAMGKCMIKGAKKKPSAKKGGY